MSLENQARNAVSKALLCGQLDRDPSCEVCGRPQERPHNYSKPFPVVLYHHHSYEPAHWLDVIPLCASCHRAVHNGRMPEPRTGRVYDYVNPLKGTRVVHVRGACGVPMLMNVRRTA
jgi:hypothetical protein